MSPLHLSLATVSGYLFTGPLPGTFAFVPADCVTQTGSGEWKIDEGKYLVSGWSRKNYLLNRVDTAGSTLFGESPMSDPATPGLADFIERLRQLA